MTVNEFFDALIGRVNLEIGDDESKLIEEKQNRLRKKLREKLTLKDDFLTGSYIRDTLIKPQKKGEKFDVDVFIAFDNEVYGTKELAELHELVGNALTEIMDEDDELAITELDKSQRRSIGVKFESNFQIDVVPAIEIEKDKMYKIFDKRTLQAVNTNPRLHGKILTAANKRTGDKLVPIIKMLKYWKREKCNYVKSFHIELLAVKLLGDDEIESYAQGVSTFFDKAPDFVQNACLKDPANESIYIDSYLDEDGTRTQLLELVSNESRVSENAVELILTDEDAAVEEWGKIFPDNELELAGAIRSGEFYATKGGVQIVKNKSNDGRIDSPRSWRS